MAQGSGFLGSPYPWRETLRWPLSLAHPSIKRQTRFPLCPPSWEFDGSADTVKLAFFGDLMPPYRDRPPHVDPALREVFKSADLAIGNCEAVVLGRTGSRMNRLQMSAETLRRTLERLGIEPSRCVLSVANNHIGDRGVDGLARTVDALRGLGILVAGDQRRVENPITLAECRGLTLGVVAWTGWMNRAVFASTSGVWRTEEIAVQDWPRLKSDKEIDSLVASPHWGFEFQHFPRDDARGLAAELLCDGFDLIAGHHPHVLQPAEQIDRGLCFYSCGNLIPSPWISLSWAVRLANVVEVHLALEGEMRGRPVAYRVHPTVYRIIGREHALGTLDSLPPKGRARMADRVRMLFPSGEGLPQPSGRRP